jgi:tRNA 2-thiouridine synthesizing protein B
VLHIVNKSPYERNALESCIRLALPGATLLLIEDGVYAAARGGAAEARLREAIQKLKVCALAPDVEARGMQARVIEGVELVDYGGFVDLVCASAGCQSWL